ncbi:MAG: dihydropteroate synthase [Kiritimatiellae bacterium]|nr:dihydropteroate synthase [Kiritimatiellia bacterium]
MTERVERERRWWQCGSFRISLETPLVMGILNLTPDSFSDGGRYFDPDVAVARGLAMVSEGAAMIDVGGESTRPGAAEISVESELQRVIPVIRRLRAAVEVPISIDTRHAAVAAAAVGEGASIINNIMPLVGDRAMARVAAESGAGLVVMHMRGTPTTMAALASYGHVVEEVFEELQRSYAAALAYGVNPEQIVVDPGIGFAKTTRHNLALLAGVARLRDLAPVLAGASRKRFIGELCHVPMASERVAGSLGVSLWCVSQGVSIIRAHDVKESCQALTIVNEIRKAKEMER